MTETNVLNAQKAFNLSKVQTADVDNVSSQNANLMFGNFGADIILPDSDSPRRSDLERKRGSSLNGSHSSTANWRKVRNALDFTIALKHSHSTVLKDSKLIQTDMSKFRKELDLITDFKLRRESIDSDSQRQTPKKSFSPQFEKFQEDELTRSLKFDIAMFNLARKGDSESLAEIEKMISTSRE